MLRVIIFNIIMICSHLSFGQGGTIHLDKPFYFEGDNISYSAQGESSLVLELYGQSGIVDQEVNLTSPVSGSLQIPSGINSQWLLIRAYQWNADASVHLVEQRFIPVYGSDVLSDGDIELSHSAQEAMTSKHAAGSSIDINLNPNNDSWVMSVAYADATMEIYKTFPSDISYYGNSLNTEVNQVAVQVPTNHGNGLHGMFNLSTGQTSFGRVKGDGSILMVPLSTTEDDLMGSWSTITVPSIGSVQASAPMFISSDKVLDLPSWPTTNPAITASLAAIYRDYLELRQINIVLAVSTQNQRNLEPLSAIKPDRSFTVEDFVRFKTTKEFFEEVVSASKIIEKDDQLDVRLLANNKKYADAAPLTIYNGQVCSDMNLILSSKIEQVAVYFKTQRLLEQFGITGRNGVMIIDAPETDICSTSSTDLLNKSVEPQNQNSSFHHVLARDQSSMKTNRFLFNDLRSSYIQVSVDRMGTVLKGNEIYHSMGKGLK